MAGTVAPGNQVAGLQQQLAAGLAQVNALTGTTTGGGTAAAPAAGAGGAAAPAATEQKASIPGTGKAEIRIIGGVTKYFPAVAVGQTATEITAFQYTDAQQFKINLDYKDGIATGLANLSRIFGARQERVRLLSNALANDANTTGSFNPVDLQKMSLETTTTQQLSEMQKKIFDSMKDSISPWLR
ncbi:MAG: hypothetical protein JWN72_2462 [Thermoleophilia bacterium]|nr:hypothetical protein [Thermoleophilia bacterium]